MAGSNFCREGWVGGGGLWGGGKNLRTHTPARAVNESLLIDWEEAATAMRAQMSEMYGHAPG